MTRALVISVRFHDGRFHGQGGDGSPEWPPSPARLFQALVASVGNNSTLSDEETSALEWLEQLPAPTIAAPVAREGQRFMFFVPNNDGDVVESGSKPLGKIRAEKTIRPHLFDEAVPVSFVWTWNEGTAEDEDRARVICRIAERLYQLGRGVDMAWADAEVVDIDGVETRLAEQGRVVHRPGTGNAGVSLACPANGSLASLGDRFASKRFPAIPKGAAPRRIFRKPPRASFVPIAYDTPARRFVFDLRAPGPGGAFAAWPLTKATELIELARDRAAERLRSAVPELAVQIKCYLVGQGATEADKALRVRIVPVPSIGHEQADQLIRRVAVYVPQTCPLAADDLRWAFARVDWSDADGCIGTTLQPSDDERMATRFERPARCWRSVTPVALPGRHRGIAVAKFSEGSGADTDRGSREARAAAVRRALEHARVRTPVSSVRVQREPFDRRGERAEEFAPGTRFAPETLWHAALIFAHPVAGPLLAGNGRYIGLGLMRPVRTGSDAVASTIADGLT